MLSSIARHAGASGAIARARGWRAMSTAAPTAKMYINGKFLESQSDKKIPIHNPATNEIIGYTPECTQEEMELAVAAASAAYPAWRETPIQSRVRVYLKYQQLVRENMDDVARLITLEQGKTMADARGDVFRGLEVVEHACSAATLTMGETAENLAANVDSYSYRVPLGVAAGITPFNFPAMIPLWMFPLATACGNTYVLKPSERDPGATMRLIELAEEAGVPPGVVNVIHGAHDAVNFVCDAPAIKAISFVGGNTAGEHIYARGTANGKRVQSNMGAKNHGVIMPDADKESVLNALVGAAFGAAGQRCMALSTAVFVGAAAEWIPEIAERAAALKVGPGHEDGVDVGPMISPAAVARANSIIQAGVDAGGKLLLDGRGVAPPGYESGNWLGPTLISEAGPGNPAYEEEVFGPVLVTTAVDSLEAAIALVNANKYGNGTAIFTQSGAAARKFQHEVEAGQVGINIPIPVPLPFFSFTGNKASIRGDLNFYGKAGAQFFTQMKTITSSWRYNEASVGLSTSMPLLGGK